MNSTFEPGTSAAGSRSLNRPGAGAIVTRFASLILAGTLCAALPGCGFLKPAKATAHYYVLTPVLAAQSGKSSLAVGLGQVKVPAYLFTTSLAVRKGTNEVEYLDSAFWAERLDAGFQRVLAADLAAVLPAEQVRLTAWRSEDVAAEVNVTLEQFDVDAQGRGVLAAQWRILSPGGEKILKTGASRLSRQGPAPNASTSGAVATLSELVAELSRELAQAVEKATPGGRPLSDK